MRSTIEAARICGVENTEEANNCRCIVYDTIEMMRTRPAMDESEWTTVIKECEEQVTMWRRTIFNAK